MPLAVNAAGPDEATDGGGGEGGSGMTLRGGGDGGSGITLRDGGVSGAPNDGACEGAAGASSRGIAAEFRGENGGVRGRTGGGGGGAGAAGAGAGAALRGIGGVTGDAVCARCDGNSVLGTGGGHDAVPDATGVFVLDIMGFTPAGVAPRTGVGTPGRSSPQFTDAPTGMRPPQTEQRARIVTLVILAGSSRKTDRHSGQDTFIGSAGLAVSGSRAAVGPA